ncbi:MAG: flagellar protein export ATPase FliI [Pseudomonadota bacterium]
MSWGRNAVQALLSEIANIDLVSVAGRVEAVHGLTVEVCDTLGKLSVGSRLEIDAFDAAVPCEVVGFRSGRAICSPFGRLEGVRMGAPARFAVEGAAVRPSRAWLGRVVDAMGAPIDGRGPLTAGPAAYSLRGTPPRSSERTRLGGKLDLGVRSLNAFATCLQGQRMGIFAGSGVGKSVLMSMMARYTACDVAVIGLIGERGREVQEFIEDDLGAAGLARSVVVVATSDEPALRRRQAAYLTLTLSEYFRDQGAQVLCLMDSVTRFAMAQREIGLSAGEPPTTKGYTPSVFAELPRLLERAGPGARRDDGRRPGAITGLFTVLVDGEDHDEPIADAVRGILDGHIVMERKIAERGRYPAINVLKSVSRTMPGCNSPEENAVVTRARRMMATYEDMAELIRIGAYQRGADPAVDEAIAHYEPLEAFLTQSKEERSDLAATYAALADILGPSHGAEPSGGEDA